MLTYDNSCTCVSITIVFSDSEVEVFVGGMETVMEEVSPYDGGSGFTGGNVSTS